VPAIERWTTRSGPRIRYLDSGPAHDHERQLPLLFVPGLTDTAEEYHDLLDELHPRRTLVVEVRGRGESEAPADGYTASDHADDLQAVLDEEGIDRYHLMTFSRGTTWALDLALRDPARVASLAIGDYQAGEVGLGPGFVDSYAAGRFRGRPMDDRISRHVLRRIAEASTDRPLYDELARLDGPLLVARPDGDEGILRDEDVERYRRARPDVEVVVVPGPTHDLFRVDRRAYPRAVADRLAQAEAEA
jgi:non-heme chloroperoxidase